MRTTKRRRGKRTTHQQKRASKKEERRIPLSFFLSFFLSRFLYEFRSVKGRRGSAKSDDERNNLRLRRRSLSRVYIYLFSLFCREENGKGSSTGESSLVFDRCIPLLRRYRETCFFRTHKTYKLKYLIEHNFKQKREKRWPRRRNASRN